MPENRKKQAATWVNVYRYESGEDPVYRGRFNTAIATEYQGAEDRDDITATWHSLYRTAKDRWVRCSLNLDRSSAARFWFISDDEARQWLTENHHEDAVAEHFGEEPGEEGPGRPEIGGRVNVLLGELKERVDEWAHCYDIRRKDGTINRAEAVRNLVAIALDAKPPNAAVRDDYPESPEMTPEDDEQLHQEVERGFAEADRSKPGAVVLGEGWKLGDGGHWLGEAARHPKED